MSIGRNGEDQGGQRQHQEDVGDVRADDVAVGEARIARGSRLHPDQEFRHRRAETDNYDPD